MNWARARSRSRCRSFRPKPIGSPRRLLAVLRHRLLHGLDYERIAGHPGVVITGEIDVFPPGDDGAVVRKTLVDREEGIADARPHNQIQPLAQLQILRKLRNAVILRRNVGLGCPQRLGSGLTSEVVFDGGDDIPAGLQFGVDIFRKAPAKSLLDAGEDLHPLQRIQTDAQDRGVQRQAVGPFPSDDSNLFQHGGGDSVRIAGGGLRTGRPFAGWNSLSTYPYGDEIRPLGALFGSLIMGSRCPFPCGSLRMHRHPP